MAGKETILHNKGGITKNGSSIECKQCSRFLKNTQDAVPQTLAQASLKECAHTAFRTAGKANVEDPFEDASQGNVIVTF